MILAIVAYYSLNKMSYKCGFFSNKMSFYIHNNFLWASKARIKNS